MVPAQIQLTGNLLVTQNCQMMSSPNRLRKSVTDAKDTPLRRVRRQKGLTLEDLAQVLECHNSTVSRIERNKQPATPDQAQKLVKRLGRRAINELQILYPERYASVK